MDTTPEAVSSALRRHPSAGIATCSGCPQTWTGNRAHCGACHRTFSTPAVFDGHRLPAGPHGSCIDPATALTSSGQPRFSLRSGIWCGPKMTDEEKSRAFGAQP